MQSPWSRASASRVCFSRAFTFIVSQSAIQRTAKRRGRLTCSETFTSPYTTDNQSLAIAPDTKPKIAPDSTPDAAPDAAYEDGPLPGLKAIPELETKPELRIKRAVLPMSRRKEKKVLFMRTHKHAPKQAPGSWGPMGAIQALNSICDTEEALLRSWSGRRSLNNFLWALHRSYDPESKLSAGWHFDYLAPSLENVQLAVDEEQRQDNVPEREPMSIAQFDRYHSMVNKMVDSLIMQAYYDEFPSQPQRTRRNFQSLDSAASTFRMLRYEGYPRYAHPSVDPEVTKRARADLADKIRELFGEWDIVNPGTKAKFQVAKICYNLLVCPVPPSMHHYNLLLVGFSRKSAYNLVEIVAQSFLEDSRLLPTPQTTVCLLNHYQRKRDIVGFYAIIRRMMAIDSRGMLIRRRWYEDVARIPALHEWARQPQVTTSLKANWVIETPSRGQDIYEALVSGLLSFDRVKDAAKVFTGSLQEGQGVSIDLFIHLVKHICYNLDSSASGILSRGLIDNVNLVVTLLYRDDCPRRLIHHLYPLLNMVDPPSADFSEARVQIIWNTQTLATNPWDVGVVRRIKVAMFIRQTETYLLKLERSLRSAEVLRRVKHPVDRADKAGLCIIQLETHELRVRKQSGMILKYQTLHKIVSELKSMAWPLLSPEQVPAAHRRVMGVLGVNIPQPAKHKERTRFAMLATVADNWLHYRASSRRGLIDDVVRFRTHAELVVLEGQRLVDDVRALLDMEMVDRGWRTVYPLIKARAEAGAGGGSRARPREPTRLGRLLSPLRAMLGEQAGGKAAPRRRWPRRRSDVDYVLRICEK